MSSRRFENRAPDHVVLASTRQQAAARTGDDAAELAQPLHLRLFAENGSAHISSLCKWGPSTFTLRTRVLPSGRPPEESVTLVQDDPTWELEYAHFKDLCAGKRDHRPVERHLASTECSGRSAETRNRKAQQ